MIVKIQRALYGDGTILIHDKGVPSGEQVKIAGGEVPEWVHEIYVQMELGAGTVDEILGGDLKGYFEAEIVGSEVVIGNRVPDQDW